MRTPGTVEVVVTATVVVGAIVVVGATVVGATVAGEADFVVPFGRIVWK